MEYVTELDKRWHGCESLDVGVLRTELLTQGGIGNKAFKLAPLVEQMAGDGCRRVMSFGGAWSNHLHALAFRCWQHGVGSVGVVRSSVPIDNLLLRSACRYGMQLHFISPAEYRLRDDPQFAEHLSATLGCDRWLPEGGSTIAAVSSCESIAELIVESGFDPTAVALPVGTGATLAGIVRKIPSNIEVIGLPVVRDDKVQANVVSWLEEDGRAHWRLTDPVKPRYGSVNEPLLNFIVEFYAGTGIVLDPVYTGKVFKQCLTRAFTDHLPQGSRLLLVHTGGLLGGYGFESQFKDLPNKTDAVAYLNALNALSTCHIDREV